MEVTDPTVVFLLIALGLAGIGIEILTPGGILPALIGTVWLVSVALLVSVPLGVAAAIYLNEYAGDNWFTRIINLAIMK